MNDLELCENFLKNSQFITLFSQISGHFSLYVSRFMALDTINRDKVDEILDVTIFLYADLLALNTYIVKEYDFIIEGTIFARHKELSGNGFNLEDFRENLGTFNDIVKDFREKLDEFMVDLNNSKNYILELEILQVINENFYIFQESYEEIKEKSDIIYEDIDIDDYFD